MKKLNFEGNVILVNTLFSLVLVNARLDVYKGHYTRVAALSQANRRETAASKFDR